MEREKIEARAQLSELSREGREKQTTRKRSMTTLKLQWVAERVRKCRRIQEAIANGSYHIDSRDVAKAILNLREEDLRYDPETER